MHIVLNEINRHNIHMRKGDSRGVPEPMVVTPDITSTYRSLSRWRQLRRASYSKRNESDNYGYAGKRNVSCPPWLMATAMLAVHPVQMPGTVVQERIFVHERTSLSYFSRAVAPRRQRLTVSRDRTHKTRAGCWPVIQHPELVSCSSSCLFIKASRSQYHW